MKSVRPTSIGLMLLLSVCLSASSWSADARAGGAPSDHVVVLMSIDGLANFYLDDPAAEMPTIRALAAKGAVSAGMRASDPTVTWPNHTTLVTGVTPARHGVVGNNYLDRARDAKITVIWDPDFDKDEIVKAPTIYDAAKSAGLKTEAIHWPASRNARSLDWTVPDVSKPELITKFSTPGLLQELKTARIDLVDGPDGKPLRRTESTEEDQRFVDAFNLILRTHKPNLALLHVLAVDHTEHIEGPRSPAAYAAIKAADGQVRQVWETLQQNFPDRSTLIIVSDHGFSLNKSRIAVNPILQQAGLLKTVGDRVTGGDVRSIFQGGSVLLYAADEGKRDDIENKVREAFANVEGIDKVVAADKFAEYGIGDPRRDPHAPDLIVFAKMGYFFGDTAAGAKKELRGSHGYDSHLPDMHAVFVACGAGIQPGTKLGEISNTAVAPTIARLLGFEMPSADGKALGEVLAK